MTHRNYYLYFFNLHSIPFGDNITISEIGERGSLTDLSIRFDLNLGKFQLI